MYSVSVSIDISAWRYVRDSSCHIPGANRVPVPIEVQGCVWRCYRCKEQSALYVRNHAGFYYHVQQPCSGYCIATGHIHYILEVLVRRYAQDAVAEQSSVQCDLCIRHTDDQLGVRCVGHTQRNGTEHALIAAAGSGIHSTVQAAGGRSFCGCQHGI